VPLTLPNLQFATAFAFVMAAVFLAPSLWRAGRGDRTQADDWRTAMFFACLVFAGFASRWLFVPLSVTVWKLLYCISIALAVYTCLLLWNERSGQ